MNILLHLIGDGTMKTFEDVRQDLKEDNVQQFVYLETIANIHAAIERKKSELNISQREMEVLTGLKQPAISRLNNLNHIPRLDTVIKVLDSLGLELVVREKEQS